MSESSSQKRSSAKSDRAALEAELKELRSLNEKVKRCPYFYFEPYGDQQAFLDSPAPIRIMVGGNRTGKSTIGNIEHIAHAVGFRPDGSKTGLRPPPTQNLILVNDRRKAVDKVIMGKFKSFIQKDWIKKIKNGTDGYPEELTWFNGSKTWIGSYYQDPSSHEGLDWDSVWFDEPPPRKMFISVRRGVLDRAGRIWFTMTPLSCPWIYNELYSTADNIRVQNFHLDLMDNPHLALSEKESFIEDLKPEEIEARIHGKFSHLSGAIFPEFSRAEHVVGPFEPPRDWPRFCVMDPHDRRPSYICWAAVSPTNDVVIYREWPHEPFWDMKTCRLSVRDYATIIRTEEGHERIAERIMDPNFARSPRGVRTLVDEYLDYNLDFFCDINNELQLGHQRIHDWLRTDLGKPKLTITSDCINMIWALESYIWNQRDMEAEYGARERPGEAGKDQVDTLRYLADYGPSYEMGQTIAPPTWEPDPNSVTGY